MAQVIGARSTNQTITETRLVRNVDTEMGLLEPNVAPLVTFVSNMKGKTGKPVDTPRVEWFEDDFVARWGVNSGAAVAQNAGSTTITVTDGTQFVKGDILIVPQAATSSTAPEQIRVVSVSGDVLTVVRNVGTAGLVTIAADASLAILGQAHEEGDTPVSAKTTAPVAKISYTEIFKKYVYLTRTQLASNTYASGGNERKRLQDKALKEFKIAMNRQFLFGKASESLTGGPNGLPVRTTMGLNSVISTNVYDASGVLTRKGFEAFARMAFRYGKQTKMLLASSIIISAIHEWGNSFLQLKPMEKIFGVNVTRVMTGHGEWFLVKDVLLEDGIAGKNGFGGWAFSVDIDNVEQVPLKNGVPKLSENVIRDGRDGEVDEIKGEVALKVKLEKTHAKLYDVTDYSS
jgi:hypothetical protein